MRIILLTVLILLAPFPAFAQKGRILPYSVLAKRAGELVVVVADEAEARDQSGVVTTFGRGDNFLVETAEADRYQVRWKGQNVWISRADALPSDRAIERFTEAIREKPTAADYAARGRTRAETGDLEGALDDANEAVRLDPIQAWLYNDRGCVWDAKGNDDKAIADFDTAIRLDPNVPYFYSNRGSWFHEKGLTEKAISDLDAAIRLDPNFSEAYYNRGVVWEAQDNVERAAADYTAAIRLDPKNVAAFINRGNPFQRKDEFDKAMADYDEALRLEPSFAMVYYNRGYLWHHNRGNFDKAIAEYDEAVRLEPENPTFFTERGSAAYAKDNFSKALADFDEAIRLDPSGGEAYCYRALILAACPVEKYRDGARAIVDATKACELTDWKDSDFLETVAAAYAEAGQFNTAVKWQQRAIELAPDEQKDDLGTRLKLYQERRPYREEPGQ